MIETRRSDNTIRVLRKAPALVLGMLLCAPAFASEDESAAALFAGLVPGELIADEQLGQIHGRGFTSSMHGSGYASVGTLSFRSPMRLKRPIRVRSFDVSGKAAARFTLGRLNFPRLTLLSSGSFSGSSE